MMKNAFYSRYGFRILLVVFFLLPFIFMGTKRTFMSNSNNVADWLPDSFEETHQYQWFLKHFPFERFVVVSWQGCTMDDSRLEMFAQKLVPGQTIDNFGQWAEEERFLAEFDLGSGELPSVPAPEATPTPQEEGSPGSESETTNDTHDSPLAAAEPPTFVPVTGITEIPLTMDTTSVPLLLTGTVHPDNATHQTVTWSVQNVGRTGAQISGSMLKATSPGVVTVRATVTNGASTTEDYTQDFQINVHVQYFKTVLTGQRLFRILKDRYSGEGPGAIKLSDETIRQKLQGILIGPDGHSTALIVTLTKEAPQGKELANVLEAIKEIGRECGVHPLIREDNRFFLAKAVSNVSQTVTEMINGRTPSMDGVILGGPPVDNVAITHEGEQTLQRLIGLCGLIGLLLAWLCFRDFRLTMFVFWLAIISAGLALASVSFSGELIKLVYPYSTFGTCDAILLSMPALVYVLAMSGAIHMINYYHDAVREHGLDMAPERAVRSAWYPCFFANLTTAFGLISLCMSGLIPISKFGFYSALGIMLQLLLLFYYLPTLLHFYPSHKIAAQGALNIEENSVMQKIWRVWGGVMIRNSVLVSLICIGVMIFFGYGLFQIKTSVKMMRFFSSDSEIIHHYTWLEDHLGPLVPMEVVVKFDNEHCNRMITLNRLRLIEKVCGKLRSELGDTIGGIMSAETMMPPSPRAGFGTNVVIRERGFNALLDNGRSQLRDFIAIEGNLSFRPDAVDRLKNLAQIDISVEDADRLLGVGIDDVKKLAHTPVGVEFAGISLEELKAFRDKAIQWEKNHGTDLWRISLRVWSLKKDIDYAHFIQEVKDVVEPIIDEANLEIVNLSFRPGDDRAQSLAQMGISAEDADRLVHAKIDDVQKLRKIAAETELENISHKELAVFQENAVKWIHQQVAKNTPVQAVYTGMVPVVYKTQHELHWGLQKSFVASFVLIGIAISFVLRSTVAGFLAMVPNLFPVFIVFGFMGHYGTLVDIGTMMTASVALGIATDDTIHFLTWFRHGIDQGMNRQEATRYAYSRSATAMFQTSVIAGLGLAAFALSTFTPTQMFGIMMLAILMMAILGDLVFLAAMLNTPLGRFFEPRKKRAVVSSQ